MSHSGTVWQMPLRYFETTGLLQKAMQIVNFYIKWVSVIILCHNFFWKVEEIETKKNGAEQVSLSAREFTSFHICNIN